MNSNVRVSLIIALAIGLWLVSGFFDSPATENNSSKVESKLTNVQADWFEIQSYEPQLVLRARTEANRSVDVKAQMAGRIVAVPVAEGALVQAGAILCDIDQEDRKLRLQHARAGLKQATIEYQGARKLEQGGYQSELAIAKAKTRLESARVALERSTLDLDNLSIKAPFAGVVERRPVEVGDFVQPGQLCAQIVELNPLKVSAEITEQEIGKISLTRSAQLTLVNGETLSGSISYLSRQANPVTRSFRIEATIANPQLRFLAGMSGSLQIAAEPMAAHLIPSSLVLLDDAGRLVVRAVDDQGIIKTLSVANVGENSDGVWVTGLPDRVALVTIGQNYVSEAEQVAVSYRTSPSLNSSSPNSSAPNSSGSQ
ncbi:efflux RND transporter periplasmic adaptor subunit [Porticoccaceae bacterium]|nr:efflux RND transporter periplasmic adaptor subunit [Porticoccaceae bacterium]MDC0010394.1 efflux RND transporter periplasmic adaptor subunit [Porticoccaceae bacterium]MDC1453289.1 efflux RND transporter periplasmic adaptor subunit [Porticoccaceae bacterium]